MSDAFIENPVLVTICFLVFVGIWIAAFASFGFWIGLAFGWLPSLVAAVVIYVVTKFIQSL